MRLARHYGNGAGRRRANKEGLTHEQHRHQRGRKNSNASRGTFGYRAKKRGWLRAAPIVLGVAAAILFFLTENLSSLMVFFDAWIWVMLVIAVCGMVFLKQTGKKKSRMTKKKYNYRSNI
jgi:predicted membrane protein